MAIIGTTRGQVAVTSFCLICFSLFLAAFSAKNPGIARIGNSVVSELLGPLQAASHSVDRNVRSIFDSYIFLIKVEDTNKGLTKRVHKLEAENASMKEMESENKRLREILKMTEEKPLSGVTASVIGHDPSGWVAALTLDKGSSSGIAPGMAVVDGHGVVGQVVAVSSGSSKVLLITDHASGVDVLVQGTRTRGVIEGSGSSLCELRYVERNEEIAEGDQVVTSGMDGVFPKGLLVGSVSAVAEPPGSLFLAVEIEPSVDFSHLEEVLVVTSLKESSTGGRSKP